MGSELAARQELLRLLTTTRKITPTSHPLPYATGSLIFAPGWPSPIALALAGVQMC